MKNRLPITVVCAVRNNYFVFRMAIESFLAYIPRDHYEEIIIVDDCSCDKRPILWLDYLNTLENIRVIRQWEPRKVGFYHEYGRGVSDYEKGTGNKIICSNGHGRTLNEGVKETRTQYMMTIDSDTIMLPKAKTLIPQLLNCFKLDDKILCVGQSSGRIKGTKIIHELTTYVKDKYNPEAPYGFPNSCLMMCDMRSWYTHNCKWFNNGGWAHSQYVRSIFHNGYKTCNFDAFVDGYSIHLGYSTLRATRKQKDKRSFGFTKNGTYGTLRPRSDSEPVDYYGGYHEIGITTNELENKLIQEYNIPFTERKCIIEDIITKNLGGKL